MTGAPKLDGEFAEMREAAMLALHLPQAIDAHGNDGQIQILRQQTNAGLKCRHAGRVAIVDDAFGKYQDAVAAVGGFSGETKTFAKTGELRKRENVEKSDQQEIADLPEPALGEKPIVGRMTKGSQIFAAHGGGQSMAEARGQSVEDQANVGAAGGVIADDQGGPFQACQIFAPNNTRMSEQKRGRPAQRVINEQAKEAHGSALRPDRINEVRALRGGLREELLDFGDGFRVGKLRFIEFHVIAMFERGEEFDAVERGEIFKRSFWWEGG